jgi:hypothetical protein
MDAMSERYTLNVAAAMATLLRELVRIALDRQRCVPAPELDPRTVKRFVAQALAYLAETSAQRRSGQGMST